MRRISFFIIISIMSLCCACANHKSANMQTRDRKTVSAEGANNLNRTQKDSIPTDSVTEDFSDDKLVEDLLEDLLMQDSLLQDSLTDSLSLDSIKALRIEAARRLRSNIDSISAPLLQHSEVGIMVYDLDGDSLIYSLNERHLMRPGSVMKTITAITALDRLGGSYRLTTQLKYTGEICDSTHTLNGNLYLVGGMDPKLDNADLAAFADSLHRMNIDTIRGLICCDNSMKDTIKWGDGWCWDDFSDNPPLTPLLYEGKATLANEFLKKLKAHNIYFDSTMVVAPTPKSAITIASRYHTMDQILKRMLKDSDNLYAETLFYHTALSGKRPADADAARKITHALIRKMGLKPEAYRVADGSGLSLYNYVTPELVMHYLRYAHANKHIYKHFYPALPIGGIDGTLAKRMDHTKAEKRVHAKTGTVTGVSALAGYINTVSGRHLAFVIMNQGILDRKFSRNFQDNICVLLSNE